MLFRAADKLTSHHLATEKHWRDPAYKLEHFDTSQSMFVHDGKRLEIFGLRAILARICELLRILL